MTLSIQKTGQRERVRLIEDIDEMRGVSLEERARGRDLVLVPTMGGLHRGHEELIRKGSELGDITIVSIFVNPKQFGPNEDLSTYPRDLGLDLVKAREAGADIVFHPAAGALYPEGFQTYVEVGEAQGVSPRGVSSRGLNSVLCALDRPGHFSGVATVVMKLFNIIAPATAVFGLKDFQQFTIIKKMVADLDMAIEIVGMETVRDPDGLALSSRNSYLTPLEREAAGVIPSSLKAAGALFDSGCKKSAEIIEEVKKNIENEPQAVIDYCVVCDLETLENVENIETSALLALAVRVGSARLIDNVVLGQLGRGRAGRRDSQKKNEEDS